MTDTKTTTKADEAKASEAKADEAKTVDSKAAGERAQVTKTEDGKIDLKEPKRDGWTAQQGGSPADVQGVPGQVFTKEQLPDPEAQRAAGIDPDQQNAGLIVVDSGEALKHPSGLEPNDVTLTTGLVSGTVRQPDRLQEADGTPRTPDGLPEGKYSPTGSVAS